ncbi:unnamed protein product [Calypogeia fissa]
MDKVEPLVGRGIPLSSSTSYKGNEAPSKSPTSGVGVVAVVLLQSSSAHHHQPFTLQPFSSSRLWFQLIIFATTLFSLIASLSADISAQNSVANFSVEATKYDCSGNMICIGDTYVYDGADNLTSGIMAGRLALIPKIMWQAGAAYYHMPVRILDPSSGQTASFSTAFTIDMRVGAMAGVAPIGDGMTFILSANNSYIESNVGYDGKHLGAFDETFSTPYKCIVVEFDTFYNPESPVLDISGNHVSFDFRN